MSLIFASSSCREPTEACLICITSTLHLHYGMEANRRLDHILEADAHHTTNVFCKVGVIARLEVLIMPASRPCFGRRQSAREWIQPQDSGCRRPTPHW